MYAIIMNLMHLCIERNIQPTDLWVGPDVQEIIKSPNGLLPGCESFDLTDGDSVIAGMRVRFMSANGIRVGCSFSETPIPAQP